MGKKKQQQHQAESFGQMVSKAALTQLLPSIQGMVNQLGQRLAVGQATAQERVFTRVVVLERLLIEKGLTTADDLASRIADIEDERQSLVKADDLQNGDTARISVQTKEAKETEFTNDSTNLKVVNCGSGDSLGKDIEAQLLGMKVGESRTVKSGKEENAMDVKITLNRSSRQPKVEASQTEENKTEATNENSVQE